MPAVTIQGKSWLLSNPFTDGLYYPGGNPITWGTIPDISFTRGTPGTHDMSQYLTGSPSSTSLVPVVSLPAGVTYSDATKILTYDGTDSGSDSSDAAFMRATTTISAQSDWNTRSTEAGVIQALNFNSLSDVTTWDWNNSGLLSWNQSEGISGGGCLQIDSPASAANGGNGNWRLPFYPDERDLLPTGEIFCQFAVKYPQSRFDASFNSGSNGDGWKTSILAGASTTCQGAEISHQNVFYRGWPQYYTNCSTPQWKWSDWPITGQFRYQVSLDNGSTLPDDQRYCLSHSGATGAGCITYEPDRWWHFLFHWKGKSTTSCDLTIYIHRRGLDTGWFKLEEFIDWGNPAAADAPNWPSNHAWAGTEPKGFAALWLLPFTTGRSGTFVDTYHLYDEVIMSSTMPSAPISA